ncbi:MAG: glycosyltransferase family 4 protein [Bacteroidota bacterium]|nr:glycosyltransferase family 4 protein [Bacteroidota bacterium]
MNKKVNILFTATFSTSFIQEDLKILNSQFTVTTIISSGIKTFFSYVSAIRSVDITFSWFASVYSSVLIFLSKVFKKKTILILGGVDVAKIPEQNYGIWNSWWKSIIVRYGIQNADIVLAVDESLKIDAIRLAQYDGNNIHVLPTGYDSDRWKPGNQKENIVLTIANCDNMTRVKIKGIDFLMDVATAMPNTSFVLVGIKNEIASTLEFPITMKHYESVEQSELLAWYQRAKVFFQPSMREGLPNTLCEAMLCDCFPVGTNVGGIAKVIGDSGLVIQYADVIGATKALHQALNHTDEITSRERIIQNYSITAREKSLLSYISSLLNEK